jgi:hypothetical protein
VIALEIAAMKYTFLAFGTVLLAVAVAQGTHRPATQPTPVQGRGGAMFTHLSSAEPATGGFKLHNVIVNTHTRDHLAVKWQDGRIIAVGAEQLRPGQSRCSLDVIVQNPTLVHNSALRYGAALQYVQAADVHIEPVPRDRVDVTSELALEFTSTLLRQNGDGTDSRQVAVTSRLNADRVGSELSIDMPPGWSLLLPKPVTADLYFATLGGTPSKWKSSEQTSQGIFGDTDLSRAAQGWLGTNGALTLLENPVSKDSAAGPVVGRFSGTVWESVSVPLLAIPPKRDGFLGLIAKLHRARPAADVAP